MRVLDSVVGHKEIVEKILGAFEQGRPGQTFLFVGPSGVGKKKVALGLAQALLCANSLKACGRCPHCLRVEQQHHEGLKVIAGGTGGQIKIEEARGVLEFLSYKALGDRRVIIIDNAQQMNPQTSNALLKVLEEPPEGTFFFLIAPAVAGILPTIRSRSRIVRFRPLAQRDIQAKSAAPAWALKASQGSFEKLSVLQNPGEQEIRKRAGEVLRLMLFDGDFLTNETWRDSLKDRGAAQRIVAYWISFVRDALILKSGGEDLLLNVDSMPLLKQLAELDAERLLRLIDECMLAEQGFHFNQDPVLLTEKISIKSRSEVYVD